MLSYELKHSNLHKILPLDKEIVIPNEIEKAIHEFELLITQKTTLLSYPGSIHWHLKKQKEKGVLEITYWPKENRLWLEIHQNRVADWNLMMIETLCKKLEIVFSGSFEKIS